MTLRTQWHSTTWAALVVLGWHTIKVSANVATMYHTKEAK
jgi:hypothetical protein